MSAIITEHTNPSIILAVGLINVFSNFNFFNIVHVIADINPIIISNKNDFHWDAKATPIKVHNI